MLGGGLENTGDNESWIIPCMLPTPVTAEFLKASVTFKLNSSVPGYYKIHRVFDFSFIPKVRPPLYNRLTAFSSVGH